MRFPLFAALLAALAGPAFAETLRIGSYPANPPWEYKDETGTFVGFEVDVVNEIAHRMGMDTEITGMDFRALFVATASNRVDAVISSLTITEERLETQSFTQPYYRGALGVGVKGDTIATLEDLEGMKVGSIAASFPETWAKEHAEQLGFASYASYDTTANMLTDLRNGRIDAAINDEIGLRYAFTQPGMDGLSVPIEVDTGDQFAIMMPKDSPHLQAFNDALTAMKSDGTMATLYEKWFGVAPAADSLTLTPLPIPGTAN